MSLVVNSKDKDDIPIARDGKKTIYFSQDPDKGTETYESKEDMDPIGYLDNKNKQMSSTFISGTKGSGKSVRAKQILDELWKRADPKPQSIILFTKTAELDPIFEPYRDKSEELFEKKGYHNFFHYVLSDPDDVVKVLKISTNIEKVLPRTLCIFDDFENLANKKLEGLVMRMLKDILERGRKMNIHVVAIMHQAQQGHFTKAVIFESDTQIFFPSANRQSCVNFLKTYAGMSEKEAKALIAKVVSYRRPFDFLIYHKSFPLYFMSKKLITLV